LLRLTAAPDWVGPASKIRPEMLIPGTSS
jgi:hypothetical protein